MWLDPDELEREEKKFRNKSLFERLDKEINDDDGDDNKEESEEARDKRREKSELDYLRGKSDTVVELEDEVEERERVEKKKEEVEEEEKKMRKEQESQDKAEEEEWFSMDASLTPSLSLSHTVEKSKTDTCFSNLIQIGEY